MQLFSDKFQTICVCFLPFLFVLSAAEKVCCFLHSLCNGYAKGTALFAGLTSNTLGSLVFQQLIVGLHCGRHFRLHDCQVIKFVNHGNVQIHGTWLAVAAVGTFPL